MDRRIFGIIKSKLRSFAKSSIYSGDDRFATITNKLVKAWSDITKENLESARNIPGLVECYNKIKSNDQTNPTIQNIQNPESFEDFDEDWGFMDAFNEDESDSGSSDTDYK